MDKNIAPVLTFLLLPVFSYAQDCCDPGGGGGTSIFAASGAKDADYRIKSVRHYAYSARHPGFTAGLEVGGVTDIGEANISPRLEYSGSLGSLDLYGAAFYSVFFERPHSHQIDVSENIAWCLAPADHSSLVFRLDNEDLLVFFPDAVIFAYTALDPSVSYSRALSFGDISLSFGLPVLIKPDSGLNAYLTAGYEHPIGLSVSLCPRLALVPEARYSGSTLTLGFAWDTFFAKAAFVVNENFTA
ncbi:MAG: hypothetical protein LBP37_03790 [Spirochaetaceae bacterium]|jgi:hypothetical protein|nr:hypothetical protein [Spirochaetaceae bacterium]